MSYDFHVRNHAMAGTAAHIQPSLLSEDLSADESVLDKLPPPNDGQIIWGVDGGGRKFHVCCAHDEMDEKNNMKSYRSLFINEFIALTWGVKSGDKVAIEEPHAIPKNNDKNISLAQFLTYDELEELRSNAFKNDIEIRLWPSKLTSRVRMHYYKEFYDKKNDKVDSHCIALGAKNHPFSTLQRFSPRPHGEWSDLQKWSFEQIKDMNMLLNNWRHDLPYPFLCFTALQSPRFIPVFLNKARQIEGRTLRRDVEKWFLNTDTLKVSDKTETNTYGIASLWVALIDSDGKARMYKGKLPGINTIMRYLLLQKPNHRKGGVARSNLMHHLLKKIETDEGILEKKNTEGYQDLDIDKRLIPLAPNNERNEKHRAVKRRFRAAMKATLKILREVHACNQT